jgi:ribosomal protein S30
MRTNHEKKVRIAERSMPELAESVLHDPHILVDGQFFGQSRRETPKMAARERKERPEFVFRIEYSPRVHSGANYFCPLGIRNPISTVNGPASHMKCIISTCAEG